MVVLRFNEFDTNNLSSKWSNWLVWVVYTALFDWFCDNVYMCLGRT